MKQKFTYYTFILHYIFLLLTLYATSQINNGSSTLYIFESINDSTDIANNFYADNDTTIQFIPGYSIYENWDNECIHYPKVDFTQKTDTTNLLLCSNLLGCYVHPRKGRINSDYGYRRRRFHYGIDIDLEIGDSVKSSFDGTIRVARYHKGYGNVVVIRHLNGLETVYGHLSVACVFENQSVKAGDLIGYGGSTGRSTGAHLHFETRYLGTPFNPKNIIDFERGVLYSDTLQVCKELFNNNPKPRPTTTVASNHTTTQKTTTYSAGGSYHYVKKGETLSYIAVKYGTTVSKLCSLNGLTTKSILQINQKIRVR